MRRAPLQPPPASVRPFGWVMFVTAVVAAFATHRRGLPVEASLLVVAAGLVLLVLSYLAPAVVRPLERSWSLLGHALGRLTTPVLLVVVFVTVLWPTRLLLALLRKDPLERRRDPARTSYWNERPRPTPRREDFERLG